MPEFNEKQCPKCGLCLGPAFWYKNKASHDGLDSWCKYCKAAYQASRVEARRAWAREHKRKNRDQYRSRRRLEKLKAYGLTEEDYDRMLTAQGDVCAICNRECASRARLSVDHDHKTGQVRGLLCHLCNTAIGKLQDDPSIIYAAAKYVERGGFN